MTLYLQKKYFLKTVFEYTEIKKNNVELVPGKKKVWDERIVTSVDEDSFIINLEVC